MNIVSIIANNTKCGGNFVHYLLAKRVNKWDVISLRGSDSKLYDLDIENLMMSKWQLIKNQKKILKILESQIKDKDVILADSLVSYYYSIKLKKKYPMKKYLALVHNDYTIDNRTNWQLVPDCIFNFLYDYLLRGFTVITTSKSAYDALHNRGLDVTSIDNGVLKPISSGSDSHEVNYWYIGRLKKAKQIDLLIKCFQHLPANCKLNIVGDGAEKNSLLALCQKYEINYKYWGFSSTPFMNVSKGDVFVLPSLVEGRSIALMEAILSGCYCIVSDIEPNKEFISYGVKTFDTYSEKELLSELLEASALDQRARFNTTNIDKAEIDFSIDTMVNKYLEVFSE